MTKLTEAQRELLTRAAADPEGAVDAPEDPKLSRPLIKQQLAISLPVTGGGSRLVITTAGRAAIAPDGEAALAEPGTVSQATGEADEGAGAPPGEARAASGEAAAPEPRTAPDDVEPAAPSKRPGGKLGTLVELLSRPSGATLEEMVAATGWLPHSVRGAMSGGLKKKQGLAITSAKSGGTRVYRIATGETV